MRLKMEKLIEKWWAFGRRQNLVVRIFLALFTMLVVLILLPVILLVVIGESFFEDHNCF